MARGERAIKFLLLGFAGCLRFLFLELLEFQGYTVLGYRASFLSTIT